MKYSQRTAKRGSGRWWRTVLATLFVTLAALSLMGSVVTRYVRDTVIDTNGYLAVIGPLPQDPAVSAALAKYSTAKLFDAANAQATIADFLPPKLAPLAGPLSETLEERVGTATQAAIQSDTFDAIWRAANRASHDAILGVAESKAGDGKLAAISSLDVSGLFNNIRNRLGLDHSLLTNQQKDKVADLRISLHQSVEQLRTVVRAIKGGAYALPYICLALVLLALAVANSRRRAVIGVSVMLLLVGSSIIIAIKMLSGAWLSDVGDPVYRAAADAIYQAFYSDLHQRLVWVMAGGGILLALAILAGPYRWAEQLRETLRLDRLHKTSAMHWARAVRNCTAPYEKWIDLAAVVIAIVTLLLLSAVSTSTLVVIISLTLSVIATVHLVAYPAPINRTNR